MGLAKDPEPDTVNIRDALSSAFDAHASGDVEADTAEPEVLEIEGEVDGSQPPEEVVEEEAPAEPVEGRDAQGRFLPKEKAPPVIEVKPRVPAPPPAAVKPAKAPPAVEAKPPAGPEAKPPQGWGAIAREKWAGLPPEVQQEVHRRERATAVALQKAAETAKQLEPVQKELSAFQKVVSPYEGLMRAQGGEPLSVIANLLQTAAALSTAPMQYRAQVLANLYRSSGVTEEQLAEAIVGSPGGAAPPSPRDPALAQLEQRVAQLGQTLTQAQTARTESVQRRAASEVETFAEEHEFYDQVHEDMADLTEAHAKRGVDLSMQQAYDKACRLHDDIVQVLEQRKGKQSAAKASASTQRAKVAASSVRTQPSVAADRSAAAPKSIHEFVEAAWNASEER